MPSARSLVLALIVGFAFFYLFAFTLIGVLGEVVMAAAGLALLARGVSSLVRR